MRITSLIALMEGPTARDLPNDARLAIVAALRRLAPPEEVNMAEGDTEALIHEIEALPGMPARTKAAVVDTIRRQSEGSSAEVEGIKSDLRKSGYRFVDGAHYAGGEEPG